MKKVLVALVALVGLISCNSNPDGFEINGSLTGDLADGTAVYLKKTNATGQLVSLDTTEVNEGKFQFLGTAGTPELNYIYVDKLAGNIPVIIERGSIEITAQKDSLAFFITKGALQNELFISFLKNSRAMSSRAMGISNDMQTARANKDAAAMESLNGEYAELQEEAKQYELGFVNEHPESLLSALIIDKISSVKAMPENEIREMYNSLSDEIKKTEPAIKVFKVLETGKTTAIGAKAPEFSAPSPSGEMVSLSSVLGKVTIIDFWAAWCKPCRAENPNVVNVYNKYHEKGLNILGVSLDRKAEDWKKAIEVDGLTWNHVSNVQYFDEIAKLYNVNAIPATFILDENGVIIAKDLRGPALEAKMAELFN